jgi:hypothetical protein
MIVDGVKKFRSKNYNFNFNLNTGYFERWGETEGVDPLFSPWGVEIIDLELSSGQCRGNCPFCYKGNTPNLPIEYMNFETYIKLFDKINVPTLTQIAFGITDIDANPDFWDIIKYTRDHEIVPNYTTNGIRVTNEVAVLTHKYCGAVAVSVYEHNKETAYDAIKMYVDAGMTQVNIHFMLSRETLSFAYDVITNMEEDSRLKGVNAIVFLQYKDKNPDAHFHSPSFKDFKLLIDHCLYENIKFGFDSCSSSMFMKAVADRDDADKLIQYVDNCESTLFSFYIDVHGHGYPCSFLQSANLEWATGINILEATNFSEVWNSPRVDIYRQRLLSSSLGCKCKFSGSCRSCFVYDINDCKETE